MADRDLLLTALGLIIALIPVYLVIRAKLKKKYKFDLDFNNITLAYFSDSKNSKLDKRFCLVVYGLHVVNNSDEANTLKSIKLSYRYSGKVFLHDSYVVLTGKKPKEEESAVVLSNGADNIVLIGWHNIRSEIGKYKTIQPGGVFEGSAVFTFELHVNDIHRINDLKIILTDFHGNKLSYPIIVQEEWGKLLNKGFAVINKSFTINKDSAIIWKNQ